MPFLEILLKNEILPNELYCVLVILNLGDWGLLWRFYWKTILAKWDESCKFFLALQIWIFSRAVIYEPL
jgi:hypothetical protein